MSAELIPPDPLPIPSDALADLGDDGWDALRQIAESLSLSEPEPALVLDAVLRTAVELVPAASAAGLNLYERGRFAPQAVFGEEPPPLDELQKRTKEGPCIEASQSQEVVHISDMRTDDRWPAFRDLAEQLGVRAMLCVPMRVDEQKLGSLSLYYGQPEDRREYDLPLARTYAALAALAIAAAQRSDNLRRALLNRDVIGQAKGILMERHRVTAQQAFDLLTLASQKRNRKLAEVAEEFVHSGELAMPLPAPAPD